MCGGGKKQAAPAPAAPTYQYFPEASRNPQQQQAAIATSQASNTSSFGSELGGAPAAPAATGAQ